MAAGDCMADQIKWQGGRPTMTFQTKLFQDQGSKGSGGGRGGGVGHLETGKRIVIYVEVVRQRW